MAECLAVPPRPGDHFGDTAEYLQLCPKGHLWRGQVCAAHAGTAMVACAEFPACPCPAILIPLGTWIGLIADEWDLIAGNLVDG